MSGLLCASFYVEMNFCGFGVKGFSYIKNDQKCRKSYRQHLIIYMADKGPETLLAYLNYHHIEYNKP